MAKPDWQAKQRDGNRTRGRDRREPFRDNVIFQPAPDRRPDAPRHKDFGIQPAKQGVKGALRAANLRLLLEKAPLPEALALVAEVPLERLEAMSKGILCPDETAFHIERALKLPGNWLDGLNKDIPERTLGLLKYPDKAGLQDDDADEDASALQPVVIPVPAQPTAVLSSATQALQALVHNAPGQYAEVSGTLADESIESPGAPSSQSVASIQAGTFPATDGVQAVAGTKGSKLMAVPVVKAAEPTTGDAEVQRNLSAAATRSKPGSKATLPMPSPELRHQNLSLLLQGKGAKSALARLIGISQPYMSTIANGGKVLDEAFCQNVAQTLGMPADWFEAPRKAADIPATALQRLAPLPRGKAASAPAALPSDLTDARAAVAGEALPMAAEAAVESNESPTTVTGTAEIHAAATSTSGTGSELEEEQRHIQSEPQRESQQRSDSTGQASELTRAPATAPVQADLLSQTEPVQAPAQKTPPAGPKEAIAIPAMVLEPAPVMAAVLPSAPQAVQRARDLTTIPAQPLILDGGLPPITEALIKVLALKARQGALSEDKAFELLGSVRLL